MFSSVDLLKQELDTFQTEIEGYEATIMMGMTSGPAIEQKEQNILRSSFAIQQRLRSCGSESLSFTPTFSSLEQRFFSAARSIGHNPVLSSPSLSPFPCESRKKKRLTDCFVID